jgi:hypothetical protein
MASKLLVLSSAALTLLMISAVSNPADARSGGGHSSSGARGSFGGYKGGGYSAPKGNFGGYKAGGFGVPKGNFGGYGGPKGNLGGYNGTKYTYSPGHRHRRFHRHIFIGAPFVYGGYYYGYGDCYWLRRRAIATGSPYWWNRYNACLYGYGYDY